MIVPTGQIERWLEEDVGHHDITNDVPGRTSGRLVAKEAGVAAGIAAAARVFDHVGLEAQQLVDDGTPIEAGDVVLEVTGLAAPMLRAERVAVNIAGHAAGIATKTRNAVDRVADDYPEVRIAGTRKTTPGLRGIEKRAIAAGGGDTHRLDLSHMVLVKDNHIAELGLETAVRRFRDQASFATKIEVEVERPEDGRRASEAGADIVMFDNLSPAETARGVEALPPEVLSEASGGIDLETLRDYAATGVDVISMGALTHSAPAQDFSFRTE